MLTGHEHNYERSYPVYMDKPDNCGPTYIILGDGGNAEGVENDFTQPQAGWSAYRDLAFGQAEFTILNATAAKWTWKADDGSPLDQVSTPSRYICTGQTKGVRHVWGVCYRFAEHLLPMSVKVALPKSPLLFCLTSLCVCSSALKMYHCSYRSCSCNPNLSCVSWTTCSSGAFEASSIQSQQRNTLF